MDEREHDNLTWLKVAEPDELDEALARSLEHDGPSLVEIVADPGLV